MDDVFEVSYLLFWHVARCLGFATLVFCFFLIYFRTFFFILCSFSLLGHVHTSRVVVDGEPSRRAI